MFGIVISPLIRWAAGILFVLAVIFSIYYKGRLDERKIFDQYKAEVAAVAAAQEAETKRIEAKNKRLFEETKNAYNTKLAALRTYYGMRVANKGGGLMPPIPSTPGGTNDYSIDNLPPVTTLAAQCAETTLTLYTLQNWVKDVYNNQ